ncbi:hypothetical protein [Halorubellus litoreus]|uniref:Uncharacterized protein n=1 Tax=Halorubellus litoreus TaxID=755308 RepID=A0ABD5VLI6_9EURY
MTSETSIPTLFQVRQLIQDNGLEGEEETSLSVLLGTFMGGFIIMYGDSSAGKDETANAVLACYPNEGAGEVFTVPNSSSPTVLFEKAETANAASIYVYPDSTNLPEHIEGLIKAHAEGEPFTHEWTEVAGGRHLEGRSLLPPDCIIYPWARNNDSFDINDHAEYRNRALILEVDGSMEQTERVNTRQALEKSGRYIRKTTYEEAAEIREHIGTIRPVVGRFGRKDSMGEILNPCIEAIDRMKPLPQHFPEARRDFPRLYKFIDAVTLYHHPDRMQTVDKNGNPVLLNAPADCWYGMKVFGEKMVLSALNLTDRDMILLQYLRDNSEEAFTVNELQQALRESGENVSDRDVKKSLKSMKHKGYANVQKGDSGLNEWSAGPFAARAEHKSHFDWQEIVDDAEVVVRDILNEEDAEEYVARFCRGDGLLVTHPFTGEVLNLVEQGSDEFEETLADAESDMADVFDEPVYAGASTESNDENSGLSGFLGSSGAGE